MGAKTDLNEQMISEAKKAGINKPVIAIKYINKLRKETGNRDHDIKAGNIAFEVNGDIIKSEDISDDYFKRNFVEV